MTVLLQKYKREWKNKDRMKERLDVLLVNGGFAPSREKAKVIIMSGKVFVNGQREDKAGSTFDPEKITIEVKGNTLKYGSSYDKTVTVSSIKKKVKSDTVVYDNAGNGYTRGKSLGNFVITGYCTHCNSGSARATSSGKTATEGITVAVNSSQIPLGTKLIIGDHVYVAQDRHGNRNHSKVVDIFFGTRHGAEPFLKNIPVYIAK